MEEHSQFQKFFRVLAERFYSENKLSDILWTTMKIVPKLRYDFCAFFGVDIPKNFPIDVHREITIPNGRTDIVVTAETIKLIVEVKLYDRKYHLKQYAKNPLELNTKFALLTNHQLSEKDFEEAIRLNWKVKKWEELVNYITQEGKYGEYQVIIDSFLDYTRRVCEMEMIEWRDMRFNSDSLYSLHIFIELAKKIIQSSISKTFSCKIYPDQRRAFGDVWTGVMYELKNKASKENAWPFFGLVYEEPSSVRVSISLDQD